MAEISVTLDDARTLALPAGTTAGAALAAAALGGDAIAARVDERLVDLSYPLHTSCRLSAVTPASPEGLEVLRHSTAHLMAQAVKRLFPEAEVTIGPAIEHGFYYDFKRAVPFTPADLERIEAEMRKIVGTDLPVVREERARADAARLFAELGERYKVEIIEGIGEERVSLYRQGEFVDLCRGPHVPSTGRLGVFKLTGVAGAYWRGDARNEMLQRIYGTAFADPATLARHLEFLAEVKRRDHRRLGRELDLFSVSEEVGPGLVLWHPKGALIRHLIETFWCDAHYRAGYQLVYTPHVGRARLWETSGHLDFYRESMFPAVEVEGQTYHVKPMNCPFHIQIYRHRLRSYRELPLRWAELGTVYRYERSGVLHGLLRVRGFTQDDAHIFCRPEQVPEEIERVLGFCLEMLRAFGFDSFALYLATRPVGKAVGEPEEWEAAERALGHALASSGLDFVEDSGGGAFYGPKIDVKIRDALGREWQCATIQFDFNMPARFGLGYRGEDGAEHRPTMIHRALLGSLERFLGVLLEHHAGRLPLWLAPVQVRVLPVSERAAEYARRVEAELRAAGLRADADLRSEKLGYKVREAELEKIPHMLVVGEREAAAGTVTPRSRATGARAPVPLAVLVERLRAEAAPPLAGVPLGAHHSAEERV